MVPPTDNPGLVTAGRNRGWCFHCGWTTDLFASAKEAAEAVNAHVLVCKRHPLRIKLNRAVAGCEEALRTINSYSTEPIPVGVYNRVARELGDIINDVKGE